MMNIARAWAWLCVFPALVHGTPEGTPQQPATGIGAVPEIRGPLNPGVTQICVSVAPFAAGGASTGPRLYVYVNNIAADLKDTSGATAGFVMPDSSTLQSCPILANALVAGDVVYVVERAAGAADLTSPSVPVTDVLDLGRMRYYFTTGVMFSNNQGFALQSSATQAGLFLGLDADRSWLLTNRSGWRRLGINTYFDARLTSVATQTASGASGSTLSTYLQSQKAASLQTGTYLPVMAAEWTRGATPYSFFVAPLAKAGFDTLTDQTPASTTAALPSTGRFFTFYSYGARLGVFRTYKTGSGGWDSSSAPDLISYVDVSTGRFGNFEAFRDLSAQMTDLPAGAYFLTQRPWRYSFEGLFKIPHSVFIAGFNANIGQGSRPADVIKGVAYPYTQPRDDLRFLLGVQFDFTKLLKAIPSF